MKKEEKSARWRQFSENSLDGSAWIYQGQARQPHPKQRDLQWQYTASGKIVETNQLGRS